MQRSATQVLYRYLPGAVFTHEEGFIATVHHVNGERASNINRTVLLDELAEEIGRWAPDQVGIPNPRTSAGEYIVREPDEVSWDVFPLTFECVSCGRVRRWFEARKLIEETNATERIACSVCGSKMRQLRYLTAHNCGTMQPLHTQRCPSCGRTEDMRLEDLGSFRSSSWRCSCGAAIGTRFTPCDCNQYLGGGTTPFQQGFSARDQRLWYPQSLTILNISGQTYDNLQRHPQREIAALASWLGDDTDLGRSLSELDRSGNASRMSQQQWEQQEKALRAAGVDPAIIDQLRAANAPASTGTAAILGSISDDLAALGGQRPMVERAALFDKKIIDDRKSVNDFAAPPPAALSAAISRASAVMTALGIEDISVTQRFPIVVASYGYSRVQQAPGASHLLSYARPRQYNGKTPIFAVPANTEALLVTFDARPILSFLVSEGNYSGVVPGDLRDAKLALAEILAANPGSTDESAAGKTRRLAHSASHALLRALDDGQSGFGESSLAEWIVPDALTAAIYVASYSDFTLGALDTVLRRRVAPWLVQAAEGVSYCDNDPMCSQTSPDRPHAACDRCLHLSFGCRIWNADLDRKLLRRFWLHTRQQAPALVP